MKTKDIEKGKTYAHCSDRDMREYNTRKVVVVDPTADYGVARGFGMTPDRVIKHSDRLKPGTPRIEKFDRVLVREGRAEKGVRPREVRMLWSEWAEILKKQKARDKEATETREKKEKLQTSQYRKIKKELRRLGYAEYEDFSENLGRFDNDVAVSFEAMFCLLGIE